MTSRVWTSAVRLDADFTRLVALAVAVRLLLIPLSHTWDGQTWANVFAELSASANPLEAIRRPYETMRELSLLTAAASRHADFYEYWAYPPLLLYLYWPLAHLYALLGGGLDPRFAVQPTMIAPSLPIPLLALIHAPCIAADVVVLFIMRALGLRRARLRDYAFNPLVLLVGVWTFDAVMVAFLLAALYLAERQHSRLAAVAIGLGTATKFVALAALPALLAAILVGDRPTRRKLEEAALSLLACAATITLVSWPVSDGVLYALTFHMSRLSAGLSLPQLLVTWSGTPFEADWQPPLIAYASIELARLLLPLTLLIGGFIVLRCRLPLSSAFLVLVLAFLAGAKIVNEPYALSAVALALVELERRPTPALQTGFVILWLAPFCYALLNTPAPSLALSLLQQLVPNIGATLGVWLDAYRTFRSLPEARWPFASLTVLFDLGIVLVVGSAVRAATSSARLPIEVRAS